MKSLTVLPFTGIGEEVLKAHILVIHGSRDVDAAASVVVDKDGAGGQHIPVGSARGNHAVVFGA